MESNTTCHNVCPPSLFLDANEGMVGVSCAAEPKPASEEHGFTQAIITVPSPPLSTDENDERELVRNEPKSPGLAKRTRVDVTDEMTGFDIDFDMRIDPFLTNDGISSDSWLSVERAADTPENEFVFVDGKDRGDAGMKTFQLEEEDFCVVNDDDDNNLDLNIYRVVD